MAKTKYNPSFDLALQFGETKEEQIRDILESRSLVEVKADRRVFKTGNICFEIKCRGRKSGLNNTRSDWWLTALTHEGKTLGAFLFDIDTLKHNITKLKEMGKAKFVNGGDNGTSLLLLVALEDVYLLMMPPAQESFNEI